jgi:hypothetical protein
MVGNPEVIQIGTCDRLVLNYPGYLIPFAVFRLSSLSRSPHVRSQKLDCGAWRFRWTAPREDQKSCFSSLTIPTCLRQDLSGSALPVILPSASSRARFRGLLVHHCCGLSGCSPPLTDLTGCYPSHEGFYIQAFNESVTFLTAGYHYDRLWTFLSVGLSPTRTAPSFAAPDPYERVYAYGSYEG